MLPPESARKALSKKFQSNPVLDVDALFDLLDTTSRMSVFRRLAELGYLSSYTHAGRYYTLKSIPEFDEHGLWMHQGVGFSRAGTLKATVLELIQAADAGHTHAELVALLGVKSHNALLALVREKRCAREQLGRFYVYLSADESCRAEQLSRRRGLLAEKRDPTPSLPEELIITVLVEALNASDGLASSTVVATRLAARGEKISAAEVERVYSDYQLIPGKKTVAPA